jgi:putative DNA primase/helicase
LPALLAAISGQNGQLVALHRTFLQQDGRGKADIELPRASLGPVAGGAIRLDPVGPELVVGEGIESSAAAGRLLGLPAWAAVSCGNLARSLVLPPSVRSVVVAADHDTGDGMGRQPGQAAARQAATRWQHEGRTVRTALPDRPGSDFADLLAERGEVAHG